AINKCEKVKKFHFFLVLDVVRFSLFSPVREWCVSDHHMPLLCRRFSSVAPWPALLASRQKAAGM
ncbi:hypothetical protein, partial [Escherichia coli]|uniref:hypothetical protein n=1 Tax=Escherichia coli TaxID=562 RepID=UPI001BB4721B